MGKVNFCVHQTLKSCNISDVYEIPVVDDPEINGDYTDSHRHSHKLLTLSIKEDTTNIKQRIFIKKVAGEYGYCFLDD